MESWYSRHKLTDILPEIFERSFDAIVVFIPEKDDMGNVIDFTYAYVNDTFVKRLGGAKEDYLNQSYLRLFPGAVEAGMFDMYKSVYESGEPVEQDFYFEDKNISGWFRNSAYRSSSGDSIILYFRDITETKNLELGLRKSLHDKEFLLKEIHHRVKNSLQIISSILSIQGNSIENEDTKKIISETQNRIIAVALIHEKLYSDSESFQTINIESYVRDLIVTVLNSFNIKHNKIQINLDIANIEVVVYEAIQLGMILNELITNSIKYAFPGDREGIINVHINHNELMHVVVEDNGIGLPPNIDVGTSDSLGMLLVDSFVQQLNADVTVDRSNGTRFNITYKKLPLTGY